MMMILLIGAAVGVALFAFKPTLRLDGVRNQTAQPAACPGCGNFFANVGAAGSTVRCAECGSYALVDAQRALAPVPADHVAATCTFQTYLPEAPRWPACCCVCGATATRTEKMSVTYDADPGLEERMTKSALVGVASLGMVRVTEHVVRVTERYAVPHCDQHAGGAHLVTAGVAFRSYGYYQQFVQHNRATIG